MGSNCIANGLLDNEDSQGSQFSVLRRSQQSFGSTVAAPSPRKRLRRHNLLDMVAGHAVWQNGEEAREHQAMTHIIPLPSLVADADIQLASTSQPCSSQSELTVTPVKFMIFNRQRQGCLFTEDNLSLHWFDPNLPAGMEIIGQGMHVITRLRLQKSHSRYLLYRLSVCESARNRQEISDLLIARLCRSYASFHITCEDIFAILVNFGASLNDLRSVDLDYHVFLPENIESIQKDNKSTIQTDGIHSKEKPFPVHNIQLFLEILAQFFSFEGSTLTQDDRICLWHVLLLIGCDNRIGLRGNLKERVTNCLAALLETFSEDDWEQKNRELVESLALASPRSRLPIGLQSWVSNLYPVSFRGLTVRRTDAFCCLQDLLNTQTVLCTGNVTVADIREAFEKCNFGPSTDSNLFFTVLKLLRQCVANWHDQIHSRQTEDLNKIDYKLNTLYRSLYNNEDHLIIKNEITEIRSCINMVLIPGVPNESDSE